VSTAATTACSGCGKATKTVAGRCPNCGVAKTAAGVPPPRYLAGGSLWDDLDDLLWFALLLAPGLVLLALALFVVASDVVLILGIVLVLAALVRAGLSSLG
jgi:hypothetical protein